MASNVKINHHKIHVIPPDGTRSKTFPIVFGTKNITVGR